MVAAQIFNSNILELKKIIKEENFNAEEADEFLDAVQKDIESLEEELDDKDDEIRDKENEIAKLETDLEFPDYAGNDEIDCGISKIEYITPDNLQLQSLMETLGEVTKKHGAVYIENILRNL